MGGGLGNREEHFSLGGGKDVGQGSLEGRRKSKVSTPWPLCLCGVELFFFSLCCVLVLFLFCCLYWLRVRCPENNLEHRLLGIVKGTEHRYLRFVGCLYNIFV